MVYEVSDTSFCLPTPRLPRSKVFDTFDRSSPGPLYFGVPQDSFDGALAPALLIAVTT